MIDTLRLNLEDCEIKKSSPLSIIPGILDFQTGKYNNEHDLFIDSTGKIIKGSKAYYNHEKFNVTIQPTVEHEFNDFNQSKLKIKKFHRIDEKIQPDLYDWNKEDEVKGIFIQTSLPRLLNDSNLKTLTQDEQKQALKTLEHLLKNSGIKTNIFSAKLSRLDTFTNIKTDLSFNNYSEVFSILECSRLKSVGYEDETFLWKNGNVQLTVYDKIKEQKNKYKDFKSSLNNVARFENRLLKKRKIVSSLNFVSVDDIYKNYDQLKLFHKKQFEDNLFKYSEDEFNGLIEKNIQQRLIQAKKIFGKKWFNGYCFNFGVYQLSRSVSLDFMDKMIDVLDNVSESNKRVKKHRIKKQFEQAKIYFGKTGKFEKRQFSTTLKLYNELKQKFYKEVA